MRLQAFASVRAVVRFVLFTSLLPGCGFFSFESVGVFDAGVDAGVDAGTDAGFDAGFDSGIDASFDAGYDGGIDCSTGECRRVFLTSAGMSAAAFGGITGADAFCQAVAVGAGLDGTWMAWISDTTASASSRLAHSTVPYRLRNGALVAADWADLTDGTIARAIDITEAGDSEPPTVEVWTGTFETGLTAGSTCADWTNTTGALPNGRVGSMTTTASWTSARVRACNTTGLRLYCIEQ